MKLLFATLIAVLSIAAPARACTNPVGTAGDATFNTTDNVPAYCDGTNWIAMTGGHEFSARPQRWINGALDA